MTVLTSPRTVRTESRNKGLIRHVLDTPLASLYLVLTTTGLLIGLGVLMVLSASSVYAEVNYGDPYYFAKRQVMFMVIGLGAAWLLTRVSPRLLRSLGWPALIITLILHEQDQGDDERRPPERAQKAWRHPGQQPGRAEPDDHEHHLAFGEVVRVAVVHFGVDARCREHHEHTQPDQQAGGREHQVQAGERRVEHVTNEALVARFGADRPRGSEDCHEAASAGPGGKSSDGGHEGVAPRVVSRVHVLRGASRCEQDGVTRLCQGARSAYHLVHRPSVGAVHDDHGDLGRVSGEGRADVVTIDPEQDGPPQPILVARDQVIERGVLRLATRDPDDRRERP